MSLSKDQMNIMDSLRKSMPGAVLEIRNPHSDVLQTPSPSLNWIYGKAHGLPRGYTSIHFGPAKAGKSLIKNAMIGQLHRSDPTAVVIDIDTEFRVDGQLTPSQMLVWGIDPERYMLFQDNSPEIFNKIVRDIPAAIQNGLNIQMLSIDSVTNIQGLTALDKQDATSMTIGDQARMLKPALRMITPVIRRNKIALVMSAQITAEMDMFEQRRTGKNWKMAASNALKHFAEYFISIERNVTKTGRQDLLENDLVDKEIFATATSAKTRKNESTAHRIKATMVDSSMGPKGRSAEFTLDYNKGIINTYEEVFLLGTGTNVLERPNARSYKFGEKSWGSKQAMLEALRDDTELREEVVRGVMALDLATI